MGSLQIRPFLTNKANFRKSQMNASDYITKDYEILDTWWTGKKQSQTKPNKAKFKKAKMNVTSILTVGYKNKPPIRAPKKQSQFPKRQKPMQTSLPQRIMKKTAISGSDKTKPNKAKRTQNEPNLSRRSLWRSRIKPNFTSAQRSRIAVRCRIPEITCLWPLKFMAHSGIMPPVNRVRASLAGVLNSTGQIDEILGVKSMKKCSLLIVRDYRDGSCSRN